jgi:putative ABC transport system substrate-binding protein
MRRRQFITLLGGTAAPWPLAARAQQSERVRRIGVLFGGFSAPAQIAAFQQGLEQSGWTDGRNVRIEYRSGSGNLDNVRQYAAELVALTPDVIVAGGSVTMVPLQAIRTVPIVFVSIADPVGAGYVDSLARPGGNATGFTLGEYGLSGKWLELLKEIAPGVKRAAVLRDTAEAVGIGQFGVIQSAAASLGLEVSPINLGDTAAIERSVGDFARSPNGGLVVTTSASSVAHRETILALAARHKLPAVYWASQFVAAGGLISYAADSVDQYRRAAGYVDRILRGAKPADLPVQAPTKFQLVINLKTARALGLAIPPTLLAIADEVIE